MLCLGVVSLPEWICPLGTDHHPFFLDEMTPIRLALLLLRERMAPWLLRFIGELGDLCCLLLYSDRENAESLALQAAGAAAAMLALTASSADLRALLGHSLPRTRCPTRRHRCHREAV